MCENESDGANRAFGQTATDGAGRREFGTMLNDCLAIAADSVAAKVCQECGQQIMRLQSRMEGVAAATEEIGRKLEGFMAQNQLLERASQEHARLSEEHYQQHIIEPMVRLLFPVVDVIDRTLKQNSGEEDPAHGLQRSLIEQLQVYLAQFLSFYDIKSVRHAPRSSFDPKVMKPVGFIPCREKELDGHVARSLQAGLRRGADRVLRFESVALYRYEESMENLVTEEKGDCNVTSD